MNLHDAGEQARVEKGLLGFLVGQKNAEIKNSSGMRSRWTELVVVMKNGATGVTEQFGCRVPGVAARDCWTDRSSSTKDELHAAD
jgi:hypothetical protein